MRANMRGNKRGSIQRGSIETCEATSEAAYSALTRGNMQGSAAYDFTQGFIALGNHMSGMRVARESERARERERERERERVVWYACGKT